MGKRGPKPGFNTKKVISEKWTSNLAYAIGLIATDGCVARHVSLIDLTSKDREQLENFNKAVGVEFPISRKSSGAGKMYLRVQFKSVLFYNFLLSIGITPAKSKTLGILKIPEKYFFHFLRGAFDGDGSTYSYWDPRWRSSFMFYVCFASASPSFLSWLQDTIYKKLGVSGHVTHSTKPTGSLFQLKYAKKEGLRVIRAMYRNSKKMYLSRKRLKIEKMLSIIGERL